MLVLCIHCAAKIKIADSAFERGIPTVICPICKNHFKPVISKDVKKPDRHEEVGWLVVHDEKTCQQTFSLKQGKQIVGRKSELADKKADIMIETEDEYMSRQHFIINVERNSLGGLNYCLSDNSAKNKTFLKKKALNKDDEYLLQDDDVIQAGQTNIVFKTNKQVRNKKEATQVVAGMPKEKTVVVFDF